jgi:DNA invertase Pin-like site-specific DNA recombinase
MNAIGYVRVSTEGQAQEGVSLEAQRTRVAAWCLANGYTLMATHEGAGFSGCRSDNRPGLQMALAEACKHKSALVVHSLSRLARSTKDAILISERLAKSGADLVSLTERIDTTSATGKLFFRLMAVLNEFERDQMSERTRGALTHLRNQGKQISGQIPYGYSLAADGQSLIPNEPEQAGLQIMGRLREQRFSLRKIAATLTEQDIATKSGSRWTAQAINMIIKRNRALKQRKAA